MKNYGRRPRWQETQLRGAHPHSAGFLAVRDELDPGRLFANEYLGRELRA